ncbi:MAG: ISKra4 family transposase, partial [candidate division NC10 bacterium]|nr:ISKra4 family transposase [candidate division NC10 bacterium]
AGRRPTAFATVLGPLTLERAYYHCAACAADFCPRDQALGLEGTSLSPAVTRLVGGVGALVSFQEGSELLRELAGVEVTPKHVERAAEALGREIAGDERRVVEPVPPAAVAPTLYLGMDGTGIPMRAAELAGRVGKQPDGAAQTREVKLCTVWSAEGRDADGTPVRDPGSVSYSAALESAASRDTDDHPSAFAARVVREAPRRGVAQAPRRVVSMPRST